MRERIHSLLVSGRATPITELELLLKRQGVETTRARNCAEAEAALRHLERPLVVFTDAVVTDGTWADVQVLTEKLRPRVPLIVLSRFVNLALYLDALEGGASDFVVPPFRDADLAYVVEGALLHEIEGSRLPHAMTETKVEENDDAQDYDGVGGRTLYAQVGR